ncbi:MAG TPA: hypothetical protein VIQ80_01650 [Candidatus Saccharimonadales bacterium]
MGDILNAFLSVSHSSDGTLKDGASATDTTVVHTSGNETVGGVKTFSSSPVVPTPTLGTQVANKTYIDSLPHTLLLPTYSKQGNLSVLTGTMKLPISGTHTIVGTRLMVGTAPTGANLILDIKKNGTTIYTTQANRPTIVAGATSGGPGAAPDVTALAAGDYLTVDIAQVGSTVPGADLTVVIVTTTVG